MFDKLTSGLELHSKALVVRAERQRMIASNIANADTPGHQRAD
jgi:flagellar basal-body rod protein FlgB